MASESTPIADPAVTPPPDSATLTEEFRLAEVERGRHSFAYFFVAICGLIDADPRTGESRLADIHYDLMAFLEGRPPHFPWNRGVVCAFRGAGKSTICRIYALWRILYIKNLSCLLISNSATNAQQNHFLPVVRLLTSSRRSSYIQWLFADRFPKDDPNWSNSERINLVRDDPQAGPSLYYLGVDSKWEGLHPDLIILDDPEGSEAEDSKKANQAAYSAYQKTIPLPREPSLSQILVVATPWGPDPLVYKLRDLNRWSSPADNATSPVKCWWVPAETDKGESAWPQKFSIEYLKSISKEPIYETQYLLKRRATGESLFNVAQIREHAYEWVGPTKDEIAYKGFRFDAEALTEEGYVRPELTDAVVRLSQCRFFIHYDPLHKGAEQKRSIAYQRPAKAAIVVVAVAPDYHCFAIDFWCEDVGLEVQAPALFRFYRLYAPYMVTYEDVGAQAWLVPYVKMMEKMSPYWQNPKSAGIIPGIPAMELPRLSTRLKAGDKAVESKEMIYREALSPWLHHGTLHLHSSQNAIFDQLDNVADEKQALDLLDCLAQGASGLADEDGRSVWQPPLGEKYQRQWAQRRQYVETFVRKDRVAKRTGVVAPGWGRQ